jgi:hypothetical protein
MFITTCTINVGKGVGNRSLVMEIFSFVDLFFILEPPVDSGGNFMAHENVFYDLLSFEKGSGVEVFVRSSMLGMFTMGEHGRCGASVKY